MVDPNPEITSQRYHGDNCHVAMLMPATTATVIGSDVITHPSTHTPPAGMIHGGPAAINPPDRPIYAPPAALPRSDLSPCPGSASQPSPSADSGFVASPVQLTDHVSFSVHHHQNVPPDIIFDYVETKLRELVLYDLIRFVHYLFIYLYLYLYLYLSSDWFTSSK